MGVIVLALVASVGVAVYSLWRRGARGAAAPILPSSGAGVDRTVETLQPGDIVSHVGADYLVESVIILNEEGCQTQLVKLVDGSKVRWLVKRPAVDDPWLLEEEGEPLFDSHPPESLPFRGIHYRVSARETAKVCGLGPAAVPAPSVQLFEYRGGGATRLIALAWPDRLQWFSGEEIGAHLLELLPGPGR